MKECDLVIEAVFEDRKIKAQVTQQTEAVISEQAIFASNTSTIPITLLAQGSKRPQNFIGLHFFSPVERMPLVEIIRGEKSSPFAEALSLDYIKAIKKTPIVVNDGRGFYTSRVFTTYIEEGIACLNDGINPAMVENGGLAAGMPLGPLAIADEVSLELIYHILKQTKNDLGEGSVADFLDQTIDLFVTKLKRLGRKTAAGFYQYPPEGKKYLWPKLAEYFPQRKEQVTIEEIKARLLFRQSLETVKCLEENILQSTTAGDVASILGLGFPAYTGGTISYIDFIGTRKFVEKSRELQDRWGGRFKIPALLAELAKDNRSFFEGM